MLFNRVGGPDTLVTIPGVLTVVATVVAVVDSTVVVASVDVGPVSTVVAAVSVGTVVAVVSAKEVFPAVAVVAAAVCVVAVVGVSVIMSILGVVDVLSLWLNCWHDARAIVTKITAKKKQISFFIVLPPFL